MSFAPNNFTVWAEIPVTDLDRAIGFYEAVFSTTLKKVEDMGPNPLALFPTENGNGVAGHLYPGKPAKAGQGPTVHLAVPDRLEDAVKRLEEAGGTAHSEPIAIPAGRFVYCSDPDGNSIGLFAYAG